MKEVTIWLAFGAGLLSFVSPCVLPIYPAFLSYITGMSLDEVKDKGLIQKQSFLHTLFFLIGFSLVFLVLGFSTNFFSKIFFQHMEMIRQLGAILVIFFGLMIAGILKPEFFMKDRRFQFRNRPSGYLGSGLIGLAFAAGWTPCMGPILAAILILAATNPGTGLLYMSSYVLGFALPFFLLSFFIGRIGWIHRRSELFMRIGGGFMIIIGFMLFFDHMNYLIRWLLPVFGGFSGF